MRSLLAAVLLVLASSCSATRHAGLRATAQEDGFTVHALDQATAERVLAGCVAVAPAVLAGPTSGPATPVEVYCVPVERCYGEGRNLTSGVPGQRQSQCIEIDIGREFAWERFVIAHELAHYWLAPEWNVLPQILEEGLADMAGERADPQAGVCRRLFHGLRLVTWAGIGWPYVLEHDGRHEAGMLHLGKPEPGLPDFGTMLELDGTNYHDVGGEQNENLLYAVGYALVEQLGVPKLAQLCARARVEGLTQIPADWVLDAAGLSRTSGSMWAISGQRLIGDPEQRMLQDCLREEGPFHFGKESR